MLMHCDNQETIFLGRNLIFHERTKHIEINCHFIHDKVLKRVILTSQVSSIDWLGNIFTMSLTSVSYDSFNSKLGLFDQYDPSWGGVLDIAF